ncbi:zinc finger CCCH domain-containing protein 43-like isoform X2 [Phragmites australis]|uniref:zinc finger CCCH domain-containing protein 43-like isoform X2 n=1 Tax=Phragmites australis TaxID=29695 RepID=UPI002D78B6BF|nr:zinc finger CCCH domain-containing protein 43-like isoform X2 [Phragmites australis]
MRITQTTSPRLHHCSYHYVTFGSCKHGMNCISYHPPKLSEPERRAPSGDQQEQVLEYPQRHGEPDCSYYVKFGSCKYGMNCMFNHPPNPSVALLQAHEKQEPEPEYPRRPGEPDCSHYVKFGSCKYGMNCIFNHPPNPSGWQRQWHARAGDKPEQETEYPQRPGEPDCSYYVKFGSCKHGMNCRFNHPLRKLVMVQTQSYNRYDLADSREWRSHSPRTQSYNRYDRADSREWRSRSPQTQSYKRYDLADSREWRLRSAQTPVAVSEEKSSNNIHEAEESNDSSGKQEQLYKHGQLCFQLESKAQDILELKKDIDVELHDEDHRWAHNDWNVQTKSYNRYDLADSREWRSRSPQTQSYKRYDLADRREWRLRSAQTPAAVREEKSWNNICEAEESNDSSGKQEQLYKHGQLCFQFESNAQAMMDCEKFRFTPLENVHVPNIMFEDMLDSSSTAPEANLAINTTIGSKQDSRDASFIGTNDKDVRKKSEEAMLRKSSNQEPNSTKPEKNYMHQEFNHPVDFGDNVSPRNSSALLRINQVGCSISEIMELVIEAGAVEGSDEHFIATQLFIRPEYREMFLTHTTKGRHVWLKRMCQLKK